MSKIKRILALVLSAAMILVLCGCSLFDTTLIKSVRAMGKLESFHADITADLSGRISVMENSYDLDLKADAESDMILNPMALRLEGRLCDYDFLPSVLIYAKSDPGVLKFAFGTSVSSSLSQYAMDLPDESFTINVEDIIKLLTSGTLLFEEKGTEDINSSPAVRYDGVLNEQALEAIISLSGIDEDIDIENDIPVSVWIDTKTYMIVRLDADLSALAPAVAAYVADAVNLDIAGTEIPLELSADKLYLSILFSQFNSVEEIQLPEGM